ARSALFAARCRQCLEGEDRSTPDRWLLAAASEDSEKCCLIFQRYSEGCQPDILAAHPATAHLADTPRYVPSAPEQKGKRVHRALSTHSDRRYGFRHHRSNHTRRSGPEY